MKIDYRISMWNYTHYARTGSFEEVIRQISENGYGVEIWPSFKEEKDLFGESQREWLKKLLEGINTSMHGSSVNTLDGHKSQIDTAAYIGADVIVVHPGNLKIHGDVDYDFAGEVVAYAKERNVTIALENGPLNALEKAMERMDDLKICLDTGHVYFTTAPMSDYLKILKPRLTHLHLQDTLPGTDHYTLGTGTIPKSDWQLLWDTLHEIDFKGAGIFEIRPRTPLQTVKESMEFLKVLEHR